MPPLPDPRPSSQGVAHFPLGGAELSIVPGAYGRGTAFEAADRLRHRVGQSRILSKLSVGMHRKKTNTLAKTKLTRNMRREANASQFVTMPNGNTWRTRCVSLEGRKRSRLLQEGGEIRPPTQDSRGSKSGTSHGQGGKDTQDPRCRVRQRPPITPAADVVRCR